MKQIVVLSLIVSLAASAQAQTDARATVKAQARKMGEALVKKDYLAFVKTTYPKAVEATEGGHEKMAADLDKQIKDMAANGTTIIAMWPGEPSKTVIDTAGELQCTIPQKMTMKMPGAKLTTETTLIALSPDKGKNWYFIDVADRNLGRMRSMFPNISSRLVIPPSPEPTTVPDTK